VTVQQQQRRTVAPHQGVNLHAIFDGDAACAHPFEQRMVVGLQGI
jgi:hypothetical protein